ncbi:MAG: plasmid recombination protein [Deltaproteobacteria bacterium]|jgi:hypothetical protein|nr:plasmid recombination protein [Deltaproteobacteria bacterium]
MSYATICRVQPVKRGNMARLAKHNARESHMPAHADNKPVQGSRVLFGSGDPASALQNALSGLSQARAGKVAADEYVGAEIVLSAHAEYFKSLDKAGLEKWAERSVQWLEAQQTASEPKGRLVSIILHMDEDAPRICGLYAPIVEIARKHPATKEMMPGKVVLAYSKLYGDTFTTLAAARKEGRSHLDTKLGRLQTSYADAVKTCGLIRGKESRRSREEKKPELESTQATLTQELVDLNAEKARLAKEMPRLREDADKLNKALEYLREDYAREAEKARRHIAEYQRAIQNANAVWDRGQKRLQDLQGQVDGLRMERDALEEERGSFNGDCGMTPHRHVQA